MAFKPFTGNHELVHKAVEKTAETPPDEKKEAKKPRDPVYDSTEEEDPEADKVINDLTELDRLLYHVQAIDSECSIVPQGAMKMTTKHEVARNEAFNGLTQERVGNLESYSHFRVVQDPAKRELLEVDEAIFKENFLEDVAEDKPAGCWSI